jgi:hypothetical protein
MDRRAVGALAGVVGAVVFVTVFTVEGWLRSGYDSRHMFVSELALGPRGFVQTLNFFLLGVTQLLFGRGLAAEFPDGPASRAGPLFLRVGGWDRAPPTTPREGVRPWGVEVGWKSLHIRTALPSVKLYALSKADPELSVFRSNAALALARWRKAARGR